VNELFKLSCRWQFRMIIGSGSLPVAYATSIKGFFLGLKLQGRDATRAPRLFRRTHGAMSRIPNTSLRRCENIICVGREILTAGYGLAGYNTV
jgi:hypothetical protein